METMSRGTKPRQRGFAAYLALTLALMLPACSAHTEQKPGAASEPEIFPADLVRVTVRYAGDRDEGREGQSCGIKVEPETAYIAYQYKEDYRYAPDDVEVLWKVYGLEEGHTIFMVAKEDTPRGVFNAPKTYDDREAFYIDGENNAIRSGEVVSFPDEVMEQQPKLLRWKYDVVVVDARGRELCRIDPQVVVSGHP